MVPALTCTILPASSRGPAFGSKCFGLLPTSTCAGKKSGGFPRRASIPPSACSLPGAVPHAASVTFSRRNLVSVCRSQRPASRAAIAGNGNDWPCSASVTEGPTKPAVLQPRNQSGDGCRHLLQRSWPSWSILLPSFSPRSSWPATCGCARFSTCQQLQRARRICLTCRRGVETGPTFNRKDAPAGLPPELSAGGGGPPGNDRPGVVIAISEDRREPNCGRWLPQRPSLGRAQGLRRICWRAPVSSRVSAAVTVRRERQRLQRRGLRLVSPRNLASGPPSLAVVFRSMFAGFDRPGGDRSVRPAKPAFHGIVPELAPFYRDATVVVVPLRRAPGLTSSWSTPPPPGARRIVATSTPHPRRRSILAGNGVLAADTPAEFSARDPSALS